MAEGKYALLSACGLILVCAGNEVTTWDRGYIFESFAQWERVPQPEGDGYFIFIASNGCPLYAADDGRVSLYLPDYSAVRPNVLWNLAQASFDTAAHAPWWEFDLKPFMHDQTLPYAYAFRPSFDTDRNLNVLGDGPYNPGSTVAAWRGWGGGNSNEIWYMIDVSTMKPT